MLCVENNVLKQVQGLIIGYDVAGKIDGFILSDIGNGMYYYITDSTTSDWEPNDYDSIEDIIKTHSHIRFCFIKHE